MTDASLKSLLDRLYAEKAETCLSLDPLEIVRRYSDPADREVAGFIAAALALGRSDLIRKAASDILGVMGPSPARFAIRFEPVRDSAKLRGFVYRFFRERDVSLMLAWLREILREYGSVGGLFGKGIRDGDADIGSALSRFVCVLLAMDAPRRLRPALRKGSGLRHFLADPADGSACKRLNLYLRWMVRRDALDLGIWKDVPPSRLVIPLDTHIARLSGRLGLTTRSTPDWKMALEVTTSLRKFDPDDPVKYDFALCTVGKLHACPETADRSACKACPLAACCRLLRVGAS